VANYFDYRPDRQFSAGIPPEWAYWSLGLMTDPVEQAAAIKRSNDYYDYVRAMGEKAQKEQEEREKVGEWNRAYYEVKEEYVRNKDLQMSHQMRANAEKNRTRASGRQTFSAKKKQEKK
jgi:hypothetical protein